MRESSTAYWTRNNVTQHAVFHTPEASLDYLAWRNDQYLLYDKLMPTQGFDGKRVLDYGCGPGNDLVGFGHNSKPALLVGADVSATSLREAEKRLALHNIRCSWVKINEQKPALPFDDASFDYIHSSGVLHHIVDPLPALLEMRRLIRPDGEVRVMVYNYDSVFVRLWVAFHLMSTEERFQGLDLATVFQCNTDGPDCPVSRAYTPAGFIELANSAGFRAEYLDSAVARSEMQILGMRFSAVKDQHLAEEHRAFLRALEIDPQGLPMIGGKHAGVDACFRLRPA